MTRTIFDQQLRNLHNQVLVLGSLVESALTDSVTILKERDMAGSRRLIKADQQINERRFAIEQEVFTLIATQQPMAGDMRTLAGVLEIVTELERIGDYAKGIANINLMIGEGELLKPMVDIPRMVQLVKEMLHRALEAFAERNVALAYTIAKDDDAVDSLYNQIYRELIMLIVANPQYIDQATYLIWVAHNLERTGDRVLNICERVIFTVSGDMVELNFDG